jgi:hypothetical protein
MKPEMLNIEVKISPEWLTPPENTHEQVRREFIAMKFKKLAYEAKILLEEELYNRLKQA